MLNGRQLANVVTTLSVQTLDGGSNSRKLFARAGTVQRQQMARESACMDVEQVSAVLNDGLLVALTK
jgi:hypothetical protein